jgi:hypothetical protein
MPEISTARLEPIRFRYLLDGAPVIGASLTVEISRFAEGGTLELLDWESGGFVAPDAVGAIFRLDFPELDAVAAPGVYYRLHDPAFPSNTVSPGVCTVTIYEGDEALFDGELRVGPIDAIDATAAAVADLQARTPASLVNGRMPVWVGAMGADVLTAAALAADAVQEISTLVASDLATAHGAGNWITATGFAVPGSAMALTPSERTTVQALILTDATPFPGARIDVSIGSRLASVSYTAPPSAGTIAGAVWATADGAGTLGASLGLLRKSLTNKLVETEGNPGTAALYDDDGVTVLKTWALRDGAGAAITATAGEPAQRSAAT